MGVRRGYIGALIGGIVMIVLGIFVLMISINPYIIYDPDRWDITVDISVPITGIFILIFGVVIVVLFIVSPESLEFMKKKDKRNRPKGGYDRPKKSPKIKYNKPTKKKKAKPKAPNTCYECGKEIPDHMSECEECKAATLSVLD